MKKIPLYLIYSRLLFSVLILLLALLQYRFNREWIVALVITGLLTDVFDGIIARRLQVSTQQLRRLDSTVDQVFWFSVLGAACIICSRFFIQHYVQLLVIIGAEALTYVVCFVRFKKEVATHAIASKVWTLTLLATIIQITLTCQSEWLFQCCFYLGLATRLEILLILYIIKTWHNDVPSVYHAVLLRKGREIKRHKLFNG